VTIKKRGKISMDQVRVYDREFKINSVKLYHESGKNLVEIAKRLGIPESTLRGWVKQFETEGSNSFPGSGFVTSSNEELYRLRRELADVKEERDILKKAMAIFSRGKT